MTTPAPTHDEETRHTDVWLRAARTLAFLGVPFVLVAGQLLGSPERDVPAWLHVTAANLAQTTVQTTGLAALSIVTIGAYAVIAILLRRRDHAVVALFMLVWASTAIVFVYPIAALSQRGLYPPAGYPGSLDPFPVATDFDYRAYLRDLLSAIVTPALWALAAAVVIGLILTPIVRYVINRKPHPAPPAAEH